MKYENNELHDRLNNIILVTCTNIPDHENVICRQKYLHSLGCQQFVIVPYEKVWTNNLKAKSYFEFCSKLKKDTIVVLIDAFDVIINTREDLSNLKNKFELFGKQIIFSGERACALSRKVGDKANHIRNPLNEWGKSNNKLAVVKTETGYTKNNLFLNYPAVPNSGAIIGYSTSLTEMFRKFLSSPIPDECRDGSDQCRLQALLRDTDFCNGTAVVDIDEIIFHVTPGLVPQNYHFKEDSLYYNKTKIGANFIHGAGASGKVILPILTNGM